MSDRDHRRMFIHTNETPVIRWVENAAGDLVNAAGDFDSSAGDFAGKMFDEFQDRCQPYQQYKKTQMFLEATIKKDKDVRKPATVFNAAGLKLRKIGKPHKLHQGHAYGASKQTQSSATSVPYLENLGSLYPNNMIFFSGVPHQNASKFSVYLQRGDSLEPRQIAMAFDVRFKWGNPVSLNCVVLNHKEGTWDDNLEERKAPYFPFQRGTEFEMIILVEDRCFKIAVNNKHFTEFNHRVDPSRIDKLRIEGDVKVTKVLFQE